MTAKVTRIMSDSHGDPDWEITVVRADPMVLRLISEPSRDDVPTDVRAALLEWLDPSAVLARKIADNLRLRKALREIADSAGVPDVDRSGMAVAALEVSW